MTNFKIAALICLGVAAAPSAVKADEWDKKTIFTFNAPVEVPGKALTPGTYVFKLLNSASDRHIVQVFDKDERHLIGTFLAIPDYRMTPPDKPLITFEERPAGTPEAIKAWYYPGDNYGNEFVYPKKRAVQLASQSHQNVPSMPDTLTSNITTATQDQNSDKVTAMNHATISAEKPSGEEVGVADVYIILPPATPPPPSTEPQHTLVALVPTPAADSSSADRSKEPPKTEPPQTNELPKTASPVPLLECLGLLSLAAGLVLRGTARRTR